MCAVREPERQKKRRKREKGCERVLCVQTRRERGVEQERVNRLFPVK